MTTDLKKRVAILGAGPIGIEAAIRATYAGFDVQVYECSVPGAHILQWGHVAFFSPWALNRSQWGEATLVEMGHKLQDREQFPTGKSYLEQYLRPLCAFKPLQGKIHNYTEVLGITRKHAFKGEYIGNEARASQPLLMLTRQDGREQYVEADIVIDATGVYREPNALGQSGLPAIGEEAVDLFIERRIPDVLGADGPYYAGKRVLIVGDGHSASTSLNLLSEFKKSYPATQIFWLLRNEEEPYEIIENDPLPQRLALSEFGNRAALGQVEGITVIRGAFIHELEYSNHSVHVTIQREKMHQTFEIDRIIANVGYRPNMEIWRELQVHTCYASEGPMKLAASLLAGSGGSNDCLQQSSAGFETLLNPEPNFFILGSKSYGRNSNFLLRTGFEQIDELFNTIAS